MDQIAIALFIFCAIQSFAPLKAALLTDTQMHEFMHVHEAEIEGALQGAHKAYRTVAVARQKMADNPFKDAQAASYYANVIVSALRGIGFGGISSSKVANTVEQEAAYQALYTIGFNALAPFAYVDKEREKEAKAQTHLTAVEQIIAHGFAEKGSSSKHPQYVLNHSIIFDNHIELKMADNYGKQLRDREAFNVGVGVREYVGRQPYRAPKKEEAKLASKSSAKAEPIFRVARTETGTPWNGLLYRDRAAAQEAITRGHSEIAAKATGNLKVTYAGKTTYSSSTATVFMSTITGTILAITNAHCVCPDEGTINSVSLEFPDSETIYFNQIFWHPSYKKGCNEYDVAVVKGMHAKQRPYIPIYPAPITDAFMNTNGFMVSFGDVNYVEGERILSKGAHRALSIKRITRVGGAPQFKMEFPSLLAVEERVDSRSDWGSHTHGTYAVTFPPEKKGESHQLDAAFSFGSSGSPYFFKIGGDYHLAGILETTGYKLEYGLPIRSNYVASVYPYRTWIDEVTSGALKPHWSK